MKVIPCVCACRVGKRQLRTLQNVSNGSVSSGGCEWLRAAGGSPTCIKGKEEFCIKATTVAAGCRFKTHTHT